MKKKETSSLSKKEARKRNIIIVLANLFGIAAVAFLVPYFTLLWLDSYTNHGEEIEVPDICRMHLEDAKAELNTQGFTLEIQRYEYSEGAIEDEVLEQSPVAGSMVKEGRKILVVLNTTQKPKVSVPGVIDNCSMREAEARILAAGFNIVRVDTIRGEKDWVYKLRHEGRDLTNGEPIPMGSDVVIVIGNGNDRVENTPAVATEYFD
ncbi:MAG: PASTA domain-containing protein [Bacteroidales bacterium]|nr:PASTA domain-containing protein [Bacteroidales bacterium]